jgi:lysozyme
LYKLFASGANKVERARAYVDAGLVVIVRLWVPEPWGTPIRLAPADQVQPYIDVGVQLIEQTNEFNIACEWRGGNIPHSATTIAASVVGAWEKLLAQAANIPGMIPLFPSNTPGGHVDHRLCYQAIAAELDGRGLRNTVKHAAIHPRPLNNPPDKAWTATNTCTFDEWRWIRDTLQPRATYWATEHGYSLGDGQNSHHPATDLARHTDYNWELAVRMNPGHAQAIEPGLAGTLHWFHAGWGHWGAWAKDALEDSPAAEMPSPSPLWARMGDRAAELAFARYGAEPEPEAEPTETPALGVDVSYWQTDKVQWQTLVDTDAVRFAFVRVCIGKTMDCTFHPNWRKAGAAGLLRGPYHYLKASTPACQGRLFALLVPEDAELPAVVDVEDAELKAHMLRAFIQEYERYSDHPLMIYTSRHLWHSLIGTNQTWAARYPLWVAHWHVQAPSLPDIWDRWEFWQYSNEGSLVGYDGRIDLNRYSGTEAQLRAEYGEVPAPGPEPEAAYQLTTQWTPGGSLYHVCGNYPVVGETVVVQNVQGYSWTLQAGSKTEHGAGGFEVSLPDPGAYTVHAEGCEYGPVTLPVRGTMRLGWV